VKIRFSCHAKRRRGKLYEFQRERLENFWKRKELIQGVQEIVENIEGFKYPLKIVVSVEDDIITVIANYPPKKGRKR